MVTVDADIAEFRFYRPHARCAYIAGDFNGWRLGELKMAKASSGYWVARLRLRPGMYRFRYYADGQWFADYAAFGIEYGPLGVNSFVRIGSVGRVSFLDSTSTQIHQGVA